uniref:Aminopeptidase n=1 Tax=Cnaphalocrocis medinalis TaxID=437488 RepID=G9C5G4_CNAME|nr:aminopeptidase N4 [Cnaphalocrocis medinalis]
MGSMMLVPLFCLLLGAATALPDDDLRAGFEMLDYGTNLDEPKYRLRDSVQPRNVYVHLDVYLEEARFNGLVEHEVEVIEEDLTQIVLHQKVVSIQTVSILDAAGRPVNLQFPTPFSTDDYYELLLINLANPLPVGNYTITISYLGQIHLNQFDRGFYRGHYFLNGQMRYYATTQFQPYYARTAFPCFDEPQFKSRFTISITRDSNLSPSYSNMAIAETTQPSAGRVRETFFPTPIVSVYLIAFHVSDFVETTMTSSPTKPFGIVSRPGVTDQHEFAADMGLKITNVMDDYFGIDYYDMGQGQKMKNDHLAIPDFPAGAMENWGMVNYREAYLLYDPNHTNLNNKIFIATILAHELAHKWFGNLVTCFWWSNLWLNESFASFFEYFSAHSADPSLELADQFVVGHVHSALNWDSGAGATPMNWTSVANNPSVSSHFSTTSYAKGASVLRMMEHFVGERTFRMGLRYYLRENAYNLGTPEDLYNGLRRATLEDMNYRRDFMDIDIGEVLDSWVQNPGSPVVNVDVHMATGHIIIKQERFLVSGATPPTQRWHIPITWTHQGSLNFQNTRPSFILSDEEAVIQTTPGHNWVMLNIAQSGLYRVNYDDHNWEMIAAYLRNSNTRTNVHKMNRAQIVNDVLYFLRARKISTKRAFDIFEFLRIETDYYVWAGAIGQMNWIRSRLEHLPLAHAEFSQYQLELIEHVAGHLGFEEALTDSTSTVLNRMQIMNLACELGHQGCIDDSLAKWKRFREDPNNLVPVNARRYVYCTGIREGDASDFEFLLNQYETSENTADMVVMLRALACTKDEPSLQKYLQETLQNDKIRVHDRTNAFAYALQGNRQNLKIVLNFLFEQFAAIREAHGGEARLMVNINNVAGFLTDFEDIQNFQTWAYANQVALGGAFSNAVSVVNSAINNLNWGNTAAPEIYEIMLARSSAGAIAPLFVLIVVALASHLFS